jgi:hypothetical protein
MLEFVKYVTRWDPDRIERFRKRFANGEHPMELKKELAFEVAAAYHGDEAARAAQQAFESLTSDTRCRRSCPELRLDGARDIVSVLVEAQVASSRSDARRLIQGKGVRLDGEVVEDLQKVVRSVRRARRRQATLRATPRRLAPRRADLEHRRSEHDRSRIVEAAPGSRAASRARAPARRVPASRGSPRRSGRTSAATRAGTSDARRPRGSERLVDPEAFLGEPRRELERDVGLAAGSAPARHHGSTNSSSAAQAGAIRQLR